MDYSLRIFVRVERVVEGRVVSVVYELDIATYERMRFGQVGAVTLFDATVDKALAEVNQEAKRWTV